MVEVKKSSCMLLGKKRNKEAVIVVVDTTKIRNPKDLLTRKVQPSYDGDNEHLAASNNLRTNWEAIVIKTETNQVQEYNFLH